MIRRTSTSPTPRPRRRVAVAIAVAVIGSGAFAVGDGAGAAPRTASLAVAAEAEHALVAFAEWEAERNPADYVRFVERRDAAAMRTAADLQVDPGELRAAWADAPLPQQRAVLAAMSQLGVPYRRLASEPGVGFDCSGLTLWAYEQAGVELPRVSRDQIDAAQETQYESATPGDLVHYPGHIGMYVGLGLFVHAPEPGDTVHVREVPDRRLSWGTLSDS